MGKDKVVLGIDTSNYTTSLSIMDTKKRLLVDTRRVLQVKEGLVGLRQSDALFQHIKELPNITKNIGQSIKPAKIVAVGASTQPRSIRGSYMPVFLVSKSLGQTISNLLDIPCYEFSHQEGHIEAGLWSLKLKFGKPFLALHISGGTTEILEIVPKKNTGYQIKIIGGTSDINAGQFIDRIGVELNLPFPSGGHMENMIKDKVVKDINIPVSVKNEHLSFSGPETFVQKKIKENTKDINIIYSLFIAIARSLEKLINHILSKYAYDDLLVVGGVAANEVIRKYLLNSFSGRDIKLHFATTKYCSDNGVGIASLGVDNYLADKQNKEV